MVGLEPSRFANRYPRELSGGQRQRVGVARGLAADPPLLLLDEPFGALDPLTRSSLQKEFKELTKELGKTVLLVTHDVREAMLLGDRIALMHAGEDVDSDRLLKGVELVYAKLLDALQAIGVPSAKVTSVSELVGNPHLAHRGQILNMEHPKAGVVPMQGFSVQFGESPMRLRHPPPMLGEHTNSILTEWLALTPERIAQLRERGAI